MDYSVEADESTGEYTATAGDQTYTVASVHLAYIWLAQQIVSDEDE